MKVIVPLAENVLTPLATMKSTSLIDVLIIRKMPGREVVKAGKEITLLISCEYLNGIIKIIKSNENSGGLVDGVSATTKHNMKRRKLVFCVARNFGWFIVGKCADQKSN